MVSTGLDRPSTAARAAPVRAGACRAGRPSGAAGAGTAHRPALAAGHNPAGIQIAGRLDTREERRRILDALADAAASRLLIACDARQTPDRGTLTLIAELAAHAQQTRVWLLLPAHEDGPARALWRAQLAALGLPAQAVLAASANALDWLETGHG